MKKHQNVGPGSTSSVAKPISLADVHARLQTLEAMAQSPPLANQEGSPTLHASEPQETRSLVFSLDSSSAPNVRVTLDHNEVVLFNSWSTPSKPRKNGDWVSVLLEVMGNPGDKAIVNVTNSDPSQLVSAAIPEAKTNVADPQLLVATWT